jgi:hypothetical protein
MPPSDKQCAMMRRVLSTFLATGKPTSREDLLREYPELDDLNDVVWRNNIFKVSYEAGIEQYLPSVWVFHFAGDEQAEGYARKSVQTLVKVLRAQFFSRRNELSRETLLKEAKGFEPAAEAKWIDLGIYLGTEMNLFQGWRGGIPQQPQIEPTKISEQIVKTTEPDTFWDQFTSTYKWHDNRAQQAEEIGFPGRAGEALADELLGIERASDPSSAPANFDQIERGWPRADKLSFIQVVIGVVALIVAIIAVIVVLPRVQRWLDAPVGQRIANSSSPTTPPGVDMSPKTPETNAAHDGLAAEVSPSSQKSVSAPKRKKVAADSRGRVDWHDKKNWRQNLKVGMTEDQVRALFGDPDHVSADGDMVLWYYGEILSRAGGNITFNYGVLFGWDEPN